MAPKISEKTELAVIATKIDNLKDDIAELKEKINTQLVTKDEFDPIKKVVYGLVSLILVGVIGAILALVIRK